MVITYGVTPAGVAPLYDLMMHARGLPFLEARPERFMRHLTAKEACGGPPVAFQRVERVGTVLQALQQTSHNGFPVVQRRAACSTSWLKL